MSKVKCLTQQKDKNNKEPIINLNSGYASAKYMVEYLDGFYKINKNFKKIYE